MQVKVSGLRRPADFAELSNLNVDCLGLILSRSSPQYAGSDALMKWLINGHPNPIPSLVGIFENAEIEEVLNAIHDYRLDFVQLQGKESPEYCRELHSFRSITSMRSAAIIKTFEVDAYFDCRSVQPYVPFCHAVVFMTHGATYEEGNGPFSWEKLLSYQGPLPFFLAGDIREEDAVAIRMLRHPFMGGVEIDKGFEIAPGAKDVHGIARFIEALRG
jgi:phosphoribosylanthranilate isomerase